MCFCVVLLLFSVVFLVCFVGFCFGCSLGNLKLLLAVYGVVGLFLVLCCRLFLFRFFAKLKPGAIPPRSFAVPTETLVEGVLLALPGELLSAVQLGKEKQRPRGGKKRKKQTAGVGRLFVKNTGRWGPGFCFGGDSGFSLGDLGWLGRVPFVVKCFLVLN